MNQKNEQLNSLDGSATCQEKNKNIKHTFVGQGMKQSTASQQ